MKCISLKSVTGGVFRMTLLALTVASLGTACNKSQSSPAGAPAEPTDEVVFSAGGPAMNSAVSTKATVVDALPSFYAGCTTGAAGSEVSVWNSTTFTGSGSPMVYKGDKWWPITDPSYHFYASNAPLSFAAGGTTVAASNATDVICAYMPSPTYKVRNTLSFEHVFARLGQVTVSAPASFAISNVSIKITPKVSGTYNLRTGAGQTDGTGWSATANGSETAIATVASLARSASQNCANDIYLVPGNYTISATWTASAGSYEETFTNKTQDVSLVAGKVNKITTTLGGRGTEIEFGVSIAPWDEATQDIEFAIGDPVPTIGGLIFAPGDLYTTGSGFAIADSWESTIAAYNNSVVTQGSTAAGRYYFNWLELGDIFSTQAVAANNTNNIDNTKVINGYRMPTKTEWDAIIDGPRSGSIVNGTSDWRWCYAIINGVTGGLNGSSKQAGLILFPDGETITCASIAAASKNTYDEDNGDWFNQNITLTQLDDLLSAGCIFLPAVGGNDFGTWGWGAGAHYYWSASCEGSSSAYALYFDGADPTYTFGEQKEEDYLPVRLVKSAN